MVAEQPSPAALGAAPDRPAGRMAGYALALLALTYMANQMDRQILAILLEPIKHELGIPDTYLGFLTGFSFAIFYATLGVPIAMLADRYSRRNIIAASLVVFSGMTLACGMVTSFWQLVLARIGVGVGEAGTSPASHSLIADIVRPEKRASAMAVYALGANAGTLIAFLGGGWIAHFYGWRAAFVALAVPGLILAVLVKLTLREPRRGEADRLHPTMSPAAAPRASLSRSVRELWAIASFRHLVVGTSLAVFAWHSVNSWAPSFLARSFGMGLGQIGTSLALIIGVCGGVGTVVCGLLTDRLAKRDIRWNMWLLCLLQVGCFPLVAGLYLSQDGWAALALFIVPAFFGLAFMAPTLSMTQALAPLPLRAFASSIYLLIVNLIGQGLGPQTVGILSDLYRPALGAESLRYALLTVTVVWLWTALHFWLASRTLKADVERARELNRAAAAIAP